MAATTKKLGPTDFAYGVLLGEGAYGRVRVLSFFYPFRHVDLISPTLSQLHASYEFNRLCTRAAATPTASWAQSTTP